MLGFGSPRLLEGRICFPVLVRKMIRLSRSFLDSLLDNFWVFYNLVLLKILFFLYALQTTKTNTAALPPNSGDCAFPSCLLLKISFSRIWRSAGCCPKAALLSVKMPWCSTGRLRHPFLRGFHFDGSLCWRILDSHRTIGIFLFWCAFHFYLCRFLLGQNQLGLFNHSSHLFSFEISQPFSLKSHYRASNLDV